jgi:hypothetical protein
MRVSGRTCRASARCFRFAVVLALALCHPLCVVPTAALRCDETCCNVLLDEPQ